MSQMEAIIAGHLIGSACGSMTAAGDALKRQRQLVNERDALKHQLDEINKAAIGARAKRNAAIAVLNAIIDEVRADQSGQAPPFARNLSRPENIAGRNQAIAHVIKSEVSRLSSGQMRAQGSLMAYLDSGTLTVRLMFSRGSVKVVPEPR